MPDIVKIKKDLEDRLLALGARVEEIEDDLRATRSADSEDRATEIEDDDMLDSLEESSIREIEAIRAALGRIEAGSYGICQACGANIDPKRLAVLPYAAVCIQCAETNEGA